MATMASGWARVAGITGDAAGPEAPPARKPLCGSELHLLVRSGGFTATGEALVDHEIEPDPGSENPFVPRANRRTRTVPRRSGSRTSRCTDEVRQQLNRPLGSWTRAFSCVQAQPPTLAPQWSRPDNRRIHG